MRPEVSAIERAASSEDWTTVLDGLLKLWAATHDTGIGALAMALAPRLPPLRLPQDRKVAQEKWLALAEDPDPPTRGRLLDAPLPRSSRMARDRIHAMASWPQDPRTGLVLERVLRDVPFTYSGANVFWTQVFRRIAESGDPRFARHRSQIPTGWSQRGDHQIYLLDRLDRSIEAIGEVTEAPLDEVELEALRSACVSVPGSLQTEAALWEAVIANPDEDTARAVLADVLQDRGDPRGEFIALQLLPRPDRTERARMKTLLREHEGTWLGPVHKALMKTGRVWRRGTLAIAASHVRHAVPSDVIAGSQVWHTLEELELRGDMDSDGQIVLPSMGNLRVLRGLNDVGIARLLDLDVSWKLETIGAEIDHEETVERLQETEPLPRLRRVELAGDYARLRNLHWLDKGAFSEVVEVRIAPRDPHTQLPTQQLAPFWRWATDRGLAAVELESGWDFRVERGADDRLSVLRVLGLVPRRVDAWLGELPGDALTRIESEVPLSIRARTALLQLAAEQERCASPELSLAG